MQVIVQFQYDTYVTTQELFTVAILVSLLVQVKFLFDALLGDIVAINCCGVHGTSVNSWLFSITQVTGILLLIILQVAVYHQSTVVQVIVAVQLDT